jgi:hypothetical protein
VHCVQSLTHKQFGLASQPSPPHHPSRSSDTNTESILTIWVYCISSSVGDPDPQDPHVFGPPGSGSGPFVRGTDPDPDPALDPSLRKKYGKKFSSLKSMKKVVGSGFGSISQRYGSGSAPKCHGSLTLISRTSAHRFVTVPTLSSLRRVLEEGESRRAGGACALSISISRHLESRVCRQCIKE